MNYFEKGFRDALVKSAALPKLLLPLLLGGGGLGAGLFLSPRIRKALGHDKPFGLQELLMAGALGGLGGLGLPMLGKALFGRREGPLEGEQLQRALFAPELEAAFAAGLPAVFDALKAGRQRRERVFQELGQLRGELSPEELMTVLGKVTGMVRRP